MVPFGLTEKQFVARYRRCLEKSSEAFINELREIFTRPVPPTVSNAVLEIFINENGDTVSADAGIYYVGQNNKVDGKDASIFPGSVIFLTFGSLAIDNFDPRYFDYKFFNGIDSVADIFKDWVAECWWKAGGWTYSVSVTLHVHDDLGDGTLRHLTEKVFMCK